MWFGKISIEKLDKGAVHACPFCMFSTCSKCIIQFAVNLLLDFNYCS